MGLRFSMAEGVERNCLPACAWLLVAEERHEIDTSIRRQILSAFMTKDEIDWATELVSVQEPGTYSAPHPIGRAKVAVNL